MPDDKKKPPRRSPRPMKIGDVVGDALRRAIYEKNERKRLDDLGFKPIKGRDL